MASCRRCAYFWHDEDCGYCSARGNMVLDCSNIKADDCPMYDGPADSGSSGSSSDSTGCGSCLVVLLVVTVVIVVGSFVFAHFANRADAPATEGDTSISDTVTITAVVKTSGKPLNMRAEPSTKSKVITKIPDGKTVKVLSRDDDWYYVQYGDYKGYCSADYLKIKD